MSRLGVRGSATTLAMVAVAIAVLIATVVLLVTLRSSLIDEIDRSNQSRGEDITSQWTSQNDFIVLGAGFDSFSFATVFDDTGFFETTDLSVDFDRLLAIDTPLGEPFTTELALTDTLGANNMRVLALAAEDSTINGTAKDEFDEGFGVVFIASSLDPVDATVQRITMGAVILGPLFVLLVGLITWILTGRSLRPVEAIRREVETISSTQLDRRVPVPAKEDEIGRLAGTMNGMLSRLEESLVAQQQFVSDASHELRSPLASMTAMLDVAERHGNADDWADTAADVKRETVRMRRLVDDLLLLARSDAGGQNTRRDSQMLDLDDLVLDAVHSISVRDGITIDHSAVTPTMIEGDPNQLRRVVINLTSNAVRHATGQVRLSVGHSDGQVQLHVDDDGAGIPPDQRQSVFERFVRLDDARSREDGGSGLGLAISQEIVQGHAGQISVDRSPAGGARFTVQLPTGEA